MDRLNYFNPYDSKPGTYEDQLTRAYLVLLKHSFHAFAAFLDYVRSNHRVDETKGERAISLINVIQNGWTIDTQKSNPSIGTNWLLSILITDSHIFNDRLITPIERNARYDAILTFGDQLTIIIENKPRAGNVWFEQLNPSIEGLSEETKVYCNAAHLQWKEIIMQLNHFLKVPTVAGYEKIMIDDFLGFIDQNFPYLNPFDRFDLCKGYPELIQRRIQNLLKSIVTNEEVVKFHHGWGFYIETPYPELKQIGFIYASKENKWWLELSFYFGDTQSQAKAFYSTNPSLAHLSADWDCEANFHVAYRSSNLVWFKDVPNIENYINFWKLNIHEIYQQKRDEVPDYIQWLKEENLINISNEDEERLEEKFYDTAMQNLNICPGFGAIYTITGEEAEDLDKKDELKNILFSCIKDGLKIIHRDGNEFLKQL